MALVILALRRRLGRSIVRRRHRHFRELTDEVVAQVIANPIGFAGDASGGPEANGADYGYVTETTDVDEEA